MSTTATMMAGKALAKPVLMVIAAPIASSARKEMPPSAVLASR